MRISGVFYTDNPKSLGLVKNSHRMKTFTVIAQKSKLTIQNYSFTLNSIFFPLPLFRVVWNLFPLPLFRVLSEIFFPSSLPLFRVLQTRLFCNFLFTYPVVIHCCRQVYLQGTHCCRQQTTIIISPLLQRSRSSADSSFFFVSLFVPIVKSLHCLQPTSF